MVNKKVRRADATRAATPATATTPATGSPSTAATPAPSAASLGPSYAKLVPQFAFYASYHANRVNQLIHIVCVPLILLTAFVLLSDVNLSALLPEAAVKVTYQATGGPPSLAMLVALAYMAFYMYLTPSALGVISLGMVGMLLSSAIQARQTLGVDTAWKAALGVHVAAWLAQFYGHGVHEGRSPALLDNLFQALFMAPIFVFIEVLIKVGGVGSLYS